MPKPTTKVNTKKELHQRQQQRYEEALKLGYDPFGEGLTLREIRDNVQFSYSLKVLEEKENIDIKEVEKGGA